MPTEDPSITGENEQQGARQTKKQVVVPDNRLRAVREYELLSQAKLGALSNVSPDTISDAENRRRQLSRLVQNKLVHGFNNNPAIRDKSHSYRVEDIFPNDPGA